MPTQLNHKCVSRAESLIHAGNVVDSSAWEAPADPSPEDCLAIHSDAAEGSKARYGYPIIKAGRLNRKGLIAAESRAAQQGETAIAAAAKHLLELLDARKPAATAAGAEQQGGRIAALRAPISYSAPGEVEVDEKTGIIKNVALMTIGPARGHGFNIDATTLKQLAEAINSDPSGVKCRVTHPEVDDDGVMADDLLAVCGSVRNARIVGDAVRGDIHLGDYAKVMPGLGDVWSYLCLRANTDPSKLGMSAMFSYEPEPQLDAAGNVTSVTARIGNVVGVDFVGRPAANPNGLLSQPIVSPPKPAPVPPAISTPTQNSKGSPTMDAELKALLVGMGLASNATDDEAMSFMGKLSADQKAKLGSKFANVSVAGKGASGACAEKTDAQVAALADPNKAIVDRDDQIVALEGKRKNQIVALAGALAVGNVKVDDKIVLKCVSDGLTVEQSRPVLLKALAQATLDKGRDPATDSNVDGLGDSRIDVGDDRNISTLRESFVDAIALRMLGRQYDPITCRDKFEKAKKTTVRGADDRLLFATLGDQRTKHFASLSMPHMCRHYLATLGLANAYALSDHSLEEMMSIRNLRKRNSKVAALAESVGDFPGITLDAFNKTLRVAYLDAPRTWPIWARRATAPDFKNINRLALSESPSLISRNQGGELKYVTLTDSKETYALVEYVGGIKLTRRAIINDDLDAFSRIPLLQASAAGRTEDDVAYAILTANAVLGADSIALFDSSTHANYTSSGTALSVASLQVAKAKMKKQKGLAGAARLELTPKFLLVPTSIEELADQLLGSPMIIPGIAGGGTSGTPAAGVVNQGAKNPFYGKLTTVGSTRLDDDSTTAWYELADYRDGQIDTIEVAFLDDEPEPVARQETDFDTEDVKFAIRHTVAAKAIDYRGVYKNVGA